MGLPDGVFQTLLQGESSEHFKLRNAGGNNSGFSPPPPPWPPGIPIQLSAVCEALSSVL